MSAFPSKSKKLSLALAGNPNVGKSVVFQTLTGMYAEVSNYPGTTVDVTSGSFGPFRVMDTPGVFSLSGFNDEERVTAEALKDCDLILDVADSLRLERDLFLTLQLLALGKPIIVALNQMDQAERCGLKIDVPGLSSALNAPVFPVSAKTGQGIQALKSALLQKAGGCLQDNCGRDRENSPDSHPHQDRNNSAGNDPEGDQAGGIGNDFHPDRKSGGSDRDRELCGGGSDRDRDRELCGGSGSDRNRDSCGGWDFQSACGDARPDPETERQPSPELFPCRERDWLHLREQADGLSCRFVGRKSHRTPFSQRLGAALLNPLVGFPFLLLLLSGLFLFIGKFLSQNVVAFTQDILMKEYYYRAVYGLVSRLLDPDSLSGVLLIGEYGVLTMVPVYLLGLLLPLIIGFYLSLSLLEDSGLLPRAAVLCDRLFTRFGLNGKAVIPMLLGFGCVTMALITTRILGTKRERLIASVLLCIAVPCSAQFSIIMAVATILPPRYFLLYGGTVLLLFLALGSLLNRFLPGVSGDLLLALPPLRLPSLKNVLQKTAMKSKRFLKDAGPMFLAGSLLISILFYTGGFAALHRFLLPLTQGLLGLPQETATLFLMSVIKRDLGAAYLYSMVTDGLLSFPQMTVALTVVTLFVPCFASVAILFKERGPLAALSIWLSSVLTAFLAGGLMAAALGLI